MVNEKHLDNLKFTRDFELYLDEMNALKNKYLIILSIKDTPGYYISKEAVKKIKELGFANYTTEFRKMYVGISNKGNIICDRVSEDQTTPVLFEGVVDSVSVSVSSKSYCCGNIAEIIIDGEDWSLNERALNFAVYDCENKEVVDVSGYDAYIARPTFYHRNLSLDKGWFQSHIYMPQKYAEDITLPLKKSCFSNRELKVQEVEKGIILPDKLIDGKYYGGVCDENFNFIAGTVKFWPEKRQANVKHIYGSYEVKPEEIEYVDEMVVYGGALVDHPGHLIVEGFGERIWWFAEKIQSGYKIAVTIVKTLLSTTENTTRFPNEFFETLGVPEDRIIYVNKPMKFKRVIVPEQAAISLRGSLIYEFTSEYANLFQMMKKKLKPGKYKKLYLAKKTTVRQNIIGEEYFISFFERKGYKVIYPEDFTVKEKAELMYGAEEVVTVDGTNAMYAIFCRPSVRLTVLARQRSVWMIDQTIINEAAGIKEFYLVNISGNLISRSFTKDLTLLSVTNDFSKYVKDFFGEELNTSAENMLSENLYKYFAYMPKYYSLGGNFDTIKNMKMLELLQNVSETFCGQPFDTARLNLTTNEDNLKKQVNDLKGEKDKLNAQIAALMGERK